MPAGASRPGYPPASLSPVRFRPSPPYLTRVPSTNRPRFRPVRPRHRPGTHRRAVRRASAGRPPAPPHARRGGRPGPFARPRRHADPHAGARLACLADPLGAARRRQDHHRAPAGRPAPGCISCRSPRCSPASPTSSACSRKPRAAAASARARCCSSTRSTASTAPSRTVFCPWWRTAPITLIGATTENPSFELNGALLSRCQVLVLRRLDDAALEQLLARAEAELGRPLPLDPEARAALRAMADGDGRYILNMAEQIAALPADTPPLDPAGLSGAARPPRRAVRQGPGRALQPDLRAA